MEALKQHNPKCTFPTLVVNDKKCIIGYAEEEIRGEFRSEEG
jgi:glutaredoxin